MNDYFMGTIASFGFDFVPAGWAACNGQLLSISEYSALYALLGTVYGGDGITTFGVPDLQGRTILNQGTGRGLSAIRMGQKAGAESVTMTTLTMPAHIHPLTSGQNPGQINLQTKIFVTKAGNGTNEPGSGESSLGAGGSFPAIFSDSTTIGNTDFVGGVQVNGGLAPSGGNIPLDITNPYVGVNFCINLFGIFPSQP